MSGLKPPRKSRKPLAFYCPPNLRNLSLEETLKSTHEDQRVHPRTVKPMKDHANDKETNDTYILKATGRGSNSERARDDSFEDPSLTINMKRESDSYTLGKTEAIFDQKQGGQARPAEGTEVEPPGKEIPQPMMHHPLSLCLERTPADEGWLSWLERLVSGPYSQMTPLVASCLNGLLEMENGEGPREKQAALADFLEAMLPSEDDNFIASESRLDKTRCLQGDDSKEWQANERGQKVRWMVNSIWSAWINWGQACAWGTDSGQKEEPAEDFESWLDSWMQGVGLDTEVCVPYVTGLLELEERQSAIAEFLADAATQGEDGTLRFDPFDATDEILTRYSTRKQSDRAASDPGTESPEPEQVEAKTRKSRRHKKALPVDLFSHWWASDDPPVVYENSLGPASEDSEAWDDGNAWGSASEYESWGEEISNFEKKALGKRASGFSATSAFSGRKEFRDYHVAAGMQKQGSVEDLSRVGKSRSMGKPPTSAVVARRMILHVLGLKDPNHRRQ